jgi:hypothetical protein
MRKWFASLAVLGIVSAAATAQTIPVPTVGGCGQSQLIALDDGTSETSWKVNSPTASQDCFNLDVDLLGADFTITGIALSTYQSATGGTIGLKFVALCPDNLGVDPLGKTPNLSVPYSMLGNLSGSVTITGVPSSTSDYCGSGIPYTGSNTTGFVGYDIPDYTLTTALGAHAAVTQLTGDSALWLCSDLSGTPSGVNRSGFTLNNYSTPALAMSSQCTMQFRLIVSYTNPNGSAYMSVNNLLDNVGVKAVQTVAVTLWSTATVQPTLYLQGAFITGFPFIPAPQFILSTGFENGVPIADQTQGTLCGPIGPPCLPVGTTFDLGAFFIDNNQLKKNGNGKIVLTNLVTVSIIPGATGCYPFCVCFGEADDGNMDGTIWKVQNPAGSQDFYNVKVGNNVGPLGNNCANTLLNIEAASWEQCFPGTSGASWASFGVYPPDLITDSTGGTPDLANPIALATTLSVANAAAQFNYPATIYDFPDTNSSTNIVLDTVTNTHIAVQWASGDTCLWLGSDGDGIDDDTSSTDCATIPNRKSYYTLDGYSTPSFANTFANMMMKINWF